MPSVSRYAWLKAPFGVGYPCLCSSANHLRGSTTNTIPAHGIPHIAQLSRAQASGSNIQPKATQHQGSQPVKHRWNCSGLGKPAATTSGGQIRICITFPSSIPIEVANDPCLQPHSSQSRVCWGIQASVVLLTETPIREPHDNRMKSFPLSVGAPRERLFFSGLLSGIAAWNPSAGWALLQNTAVRCGYNSDPI